MQRYLPARLLPVSRSFDARWRAQYPPTFPDVTIGDHLTRIDCVVGQGPQGEAGF